MAIGTKKGRLSIFMPGYGFEWSLSCRAFSLLGNISISASLVRPLKELYIFEILYFKFILFNFSSSRDRKSIGVRVMVSLESVMMVADMNIMDSIGSSLFQYSISL